MPKSKKSYYGMFFWLSVVSFIVPLFVAYKAIEAAPGPYTAPDANPDASAVDHGVWDFLLKTYVENGLVDYEGLARNHLFKEYIAQLGQAQPDKLPSDAHRLALLCNAYNAFTIDGVIVHGIKDTVDGYRVGMTKFFGLKEHILAGETVSLDTIEHRRIRPVFKEPRVHMALVCAARSCPSIRPEAYRGEDIERQLEDQARLFANDPKHVGYDAEAKTLRLSSILKWYGRDFKEGGGYLAFLKERAEEDALKQALEAAERGEIAVEFNEYDWTLNTQGKASSAAGGGKKADFGSGSIPTE